MRAERALLAEFEAPEAIERAVAKLRALGYVRMEAYTPHPMPEPEMRTMAPKTR